MVGQLPRTSRGAVCCIFAAAAIASCGGNSGTSPTAGTPCSTDTELVLFDPVPGSIVAANTRRISIASNSILLRQMSLAAKPARGNPASSPPAYPLVGPVPVPTPTATPSPLPTSPSASPSPTPTPPPGPTPFPSPPFAGAVYYRASGFHLKPHTEYTVEVAMPSSGCTDKPIRGARFSTRRKF
jgi:hypothetical protein